ncbi:MAG TPA: rhodanese-like domain-containing protein [Chitinophagales bacterium]|nr:rhodanese-like domain-containing protein [Chitinophagales bacterium]
MALISLQTVAQTRQTLLSFFSKEVIKLNSDEFRFRLHKAKKARLIDVSSKEEFRELHIPGSVNYDVLSPEFLERLVSMDKNRTYFIYCRNGKRTESALRLMEELGFRRVYALMTGLQGWKGTLARQY